MNCGIKATTGYGMIWRGLICLIASIRLPLYLYKRRPLQSGNGHLGSLSDVSF